MCASTQAAMHLLFPYVVGLGKAQYGCNPPSSLCCHPPRLCLDMTLFEANSLCPTLLSSLLQESSEACKAVKRW